MYHIEASINEVVKQFRYPKEHHNAYAIQMRAQPIQSQQVRLGSHL